MKNKKVPANVDRSVLIPSICLFKRINENLFGAFLLTVCVISKTEHEPQGGERANAELDG